MFIQREAEPVEENKIYDVAMEAGRILLQNGAEISRVEETMDRICKYYGVNSMDSFVLSNGIFMTGGYGSGNSYPTLDIISTEGTEAVG